MAFDYHDFIIFAGVEGANEETYESLLKSVSSYVENEYGIFLTQTTTTRPIYLNPKESSFILPIGPVRDITEITYRSNPLTFSWELYDGAVSFETPPSTSILLPIVMTVDVGYGMDEDTIYPLPYDLKIAAYRHILSEYFKITNNADDLQKVINSSGNTQYYAGETIPKASTDVYARYAYYDLPRYFPPEVSEVYRAE